MNLRPALEVHPGWRGASISEMSATWAWFHLERWSADSSSVGAKAVPSWALQESMPSEYQSILLNAAWIVAEALRRDGVSRAHLDAGDMRWSRRLGLALLGDGPVTANEASSGLREVTERGQYASEEVIARIVPLFPAEDQGILHLVLGPEPESKGLAVIAPSNKTSMLVRLAKRHAAARRGVDLRQEPVVSVEPQRGEASDAAGPLLAADTDAFDALVMPQPDIESGAKVDPVYLEEIAHAG